MNRLGVVLTIAVALFAGGVSAQAPGILLDPSQVDPALASVVGGYAQLLGYTYVGDCGVAAPNVGEVCSQVYQQDDGTFLVLLVDAANVEIGRASATRLADGTWSLSEGTGTSPVVPISGPTPVVPSPGATPVVPVMPQPVVTPSSVQPRFNG